MNEQENIATGEENSPQAGTPEENAGQGNAVEEAASEEAVFEEGTPQVVGEGVSEAASAPGADEKGKAAPQPVAPADEGSFGKLPAKRKAGIIVSCAIIFACAVLVVVSFGTNLVGKTLADKSLDTSDLSGGVAAKVGDVRIGENAVTAYIQNYREANGCTDDAAWASQLQSLGYTASQLRDETLATYTSRELVRQAAISQKVSVPAADVDRALAEAKSEAGTDEAWQLQLKKYLTTEKGYRQDLETSLLYQALVKKTAGNQTASDDTVLSYIKAYDSRYANASSLSEIPEDVVSTYRESYDGNVQSSKFSTWLSTYKDVVGVETYDMPSGLPYDVAVSSDSSKGSSSAN